MRTQTYTFTCEEHCEFGSNGWKIEGVQNADPLSGMGVAHDILEHYPGAGADMSVDGELMALGASFYVREYTKNMHSLGANAAADLPDIMRNVWDGYMRLGDPGRTVPIKAEYEIDNALEAFRKEAECDVDIYSNFNNEQALRIRGWMRKGYRLAAKRWKNCGSMRSLFDEIEAEADKRLKHAELGERLTVSLHFRRGMITDRRDVSATFKAICPWGEEY